MKVTDVRLRKIQTDGRMKALVSITLDSFCYSRFTCN